jgi:3-deoxy-alpha-D-manno-octulosonate 8-oxidase
MSNFRNFKLVGYVVFGRGSFAQLDGILAPRRQGEAPVVFLVDHFFRDKPAFLSRVPIRGRDRVLFADVTHEPTTALVDGLRDQVRSECGQVSGIVGIGGGSTMDLAKAVSLMLTNAGSSADYQGWDLVKLPGVYKVAVPTLSGTGAEVSRTAVLIGPTKKLGLNSDFTPFDQIVLDPDLVAGVPAEQRFYTGMDCYIHCIESLQGSFLNAFSRSYGEKALELCRQVFLEKDGWDGDSDERLMMASYAGGMSIAYSQVGVAHAVSYGLGYLLGIHHGIGNCIVFDQLEEFYPQGVRDFQRMLEKHHIQLPRGVTRGLDESQVERMLDVSLGMAPLWQNALGPDWQRKMTRERLRALFARL